MTAAPSAAAAPAAGNSVAAGGAEASLREAIQSGKLKINGPPELVEKTIKMLAALAEANPDVMQNLQQKMNEPEGLTINTQDSGAPPSATRGNSKVNAIGGNEITLDFGDSSLGGQGGMLTVLAHELIHTKGGTHGAQMDQATQEDVANTLGMLRSA
jgi:hypothetical protein